MNDDPRTLVMDLKAITFDEIDVLTKCKYILYLIIF